MPRAHAAAALVSGGSALLLAFAGPAAHAAVIYVNSGATGAGTGASWADALPHLQDALAAAEPGDEVWITAGTHRPDETAANPSGTGDRLVSFVMETGVALYGGFAGTEMLLSERPLHPTTGMPTLATILSGDLNGNDTATPGPPAALTGYGENSLHVLTADGVATTAILDGFIVRGGNADLFTSGPAHEGGGLYASGGSPTIRNCTFTFNRASDGAAMWFEGFCAASLLNVDVIDNRALGSRGGVFFEGTPGGPYANVVVENCDFARNAAPLTVGGAVGGLGISNAAGRVRDGNFTENLAGRGAAFSTSGDAPVSVSRCTFLRNTAAGPSGFCHGALGISNHLSVVVQDCTFLGNRAENGMNGTGGAIYVSADGFGVRVVNCVFVGNTADLGGALRTATGTVVRNVTMVANVAVQTGGGARLVSTGTAPSLANCIAWGNSDSTGFGASSQIEVAGTAPSVTYSLVQGGFAGTGNLNADPLFFDDPSPGGDGNWDGVNDSYGDLRPLHGSPVIDAGSNALVDADGADIDNDGNTTEPAPYDVGGRGRFREIITAADAIPGSAPAVDIGAYESLAGPVLVDNTPTGAWVDSTDSLQAALAFASSFIDEVREIWVAAGVYKPDYWPGVITPGDRTASFELVGGIPLYGGFSGSETTRSARDPHLHTTVLSGDIDGVTDPLWDPFGFVPAAVAGNSRHVVRATNVVSASLDGFTVTGGYADHLASDQDGGGLWWSFSNGEVRNCRFTRNIARSAGGGAMITSPPFSEPTQVTVEGCSFDANRTLGNDGGGLKCGGEGLAHLVRDCRFERNYAPAGGGGGAWAVDQPGRWVDCTFVGNRANGRGGGFFGYGLFAPLDVVNCRFTHNRAATDGGGAMAVPHMAHFLGCVFEGNVAAIRGGGLRASHAGLQSTMNVTGCVFVGNTANQGGAVANSDADQDGTTPWRITNCTFSENVAVTSGGAVWNGSVGDHGTPAPSSPVLANCILWNNRDASGTTSAAQITTASGDPTVDYTLIQNGWSGAGGIGVLSSNPGFRLSPNHGGDGWGDDLATPAIDESANDNFGDVRLRVNSAVIDAGSNAGVPADAADVDGDLNHSEPLPIDAGGQSRFSQDLCADDTGLGTPPLVDMGAYERQVTLSGTGIIYCDLNALGSATGLTWADAFTDLQEAICAAKNSPAAEKQVWVAAGTYRPDVGTLDRTRSFRLEDDVAVYGGFAGVETLREQRDPTGNETILSGDLHGDDNPLADFPNGPTFDDNTQHVIVATGNGPTAVLDGFTIRGGNTAGAADNRGGGILMDPGSPTLVGCRFIHNSAIGTNAVGGGAAVAGLSSPSFKNCGFETNAAAGSGADGGGLSAVATGAPIVRDCIFMGNTATDGGGAAFLAAGSPRLIGCRFTRNTADRGGGVILNPPGAVPIFSCRFDGNSAVQHGGAIANIGTAPLIVNCAFAGNRATGSAGGAGNGAAIFNNVGAAAIVNCTLARNLAQRAGGALYNTGNAAPIISNSILWQNTANDAASMADAQIHNASGDPTLLYSVIEGLWTGNGANNSSTDPWLIELPTPGSDLQWGTPDDNYGDLRLFIFAASAAIDSANNLGLPLDVVDLDCDGNVGEVLPLDLQGAIRSRNDPFVADTGNGSAPFADRGAYEAGVFLSQRVYVNAAATGIGDGSSWANAHFELRDALNAIAVAGCSSIEVWVAAGTYTPTDIANRNATFQLMDGTTIYGGFAGTETALAERNITANPTILSGDLNRDDQSGVFTDNCYHVVTGTNTGPQAVLDGFIITGGQADAPRGGGGLISTAGGPTLRNCTLSANRGDCAAGLDIRGGRIRLEDTTITANPGNGPQAGLSQAQATLIGSNSLVAGALDVFGSQLDGSGALTLSDTGRVSVRRTPPCGAQPVQSLTASIAAAAVYQPVGDGSQWEVGPLQLGAILSDGVLRGETATWYISPAAHGASPGRFRWTTSILSADLSSGGRADARFAPGGTISIAGQLYDTAAPPGNLIFTGVLLQLRVGAFRVQETTPTSNELAIIEPPSLTPIGGFLINTQAGLNISGLQNLTLTLGEATQNPGGDVTSFAAGSTITLTGPAALLLGPASPPSTRTTLACALRGTGKLEIETGATLAIAPGGRLNLSGLPDEDCITLPTPGAPPSPGLVTVFGSLVVENAAAVINTHVNVNLLEIRDSTDIVHNDIRLQSDNHTGFGGEFFAAGGALIACNVITSEGDRYLDLDPDPDDGQQPILQNNRIFVVIKQGAGGSVGELLELRSPDLDHTLGGGVSGAYPLAGGSGYDSSANPWVFERLEVLPHAKVNLTNRPGFVFAYGTPQPEALYVKELKLHPGAVLNCGLQRVYYQTLVDENGVPLTPDPGPPGSFNGGSRRVDDIPLLGFSLKVIEMEDDTEFAVRIRPRTRDPADDPQPAAPPFKEGRIARVNAADGYMQMCTRDAENGSLNAASVAAHGAFARAGEDLVLIDFLYEFESDPDAELRVYLSDSPDARNPALPPASDPNFRLCATLRPPHPGLPGSIGSGRYARFSGEFRRSHAAAPSGQLNFTRGTYVELELRSSAANGACIRIDRFDPQIRCTGNQCGDVTGEGAVAANDYLGLVAWYGRRVGDDPGGQGSTGCLDPRPTSDNYIDINDLLAADARLVHPPPADLCTRYGDDLPQNGAAVALPTMAGFLLLGKAGTSATQQPNLLYALDAAGTPASFPNGATNAPVTPSSRPRLGSQHRADVRLIQDSGGPGGGSPGGGNVYLLHLTQGLYRVDTGALLLAPNSVSFGGDTVHVGVRMFYDALDELQASPPILDAAFDPADPNVVYVAPVLVQPGGVGNGYRTVARLLLQGGGAFSVSQLYGVSPAADPCVNSSPPEHGVYDIWQPREVELDADGNLFVLSAKEGNDNDWLLIYETSSGADRRLCFTTAPSTSCATAVPLTLDSPTAMLLTGDGGELFIASALNDPAATFVRAHRFLVQRSGGVATGVTAAGHTQVNDMRHVLSLVGVPGTTPAQRRIWAFGFTGPTFTALPYIPDVTPPLSAYAAPRRAEFAPGAADVTAVPLAAHASSAVALPLSAVYRPAAAPGVTRGDTNCDSSIDFFDIDPFLLALFNPAGYTAAYPGCSLASADCNADASVDFFDIDPFLVILFNP